jgi:hypothetical protein
MIEIACPALPTAGQLQLLQQMSSSNGCCSSYSGFRKPKLWTSSSSSR